MVASSVECAVILAHEERTAQALAAGEPPPMRLVSRRVPKHVDEFLRILSHDGLPPHFTERCLAACRYVQQHGAEVLYSLPEPLPRLKQWMQDRMIQAVRHPVRRSYLQYLCECNEARISGKDPPTEPKVNLRQKECEDYTLWMQDMRYVSLFRKLTKSSAS